MHHAGEISDQSDLVMVQKVAGRSTGKLSVNIAVPVFNQRRERQ